MEPAELTLVNVSNFTFRIDTPGGSSGNDIPCGETTPAVRVDSRMRRNNNTTLTRDSGRPYLSLPPLRSGINFRRSCSAIIIMS
jgi:hypothetical protein